MAYDYYTHTHVLIVIITRDKETRGKTIWATTPSFGYLMSKVGATKRSGAGRGSAQAEEVRG